MNYDDEPWGMKHAAIGLGFLTSFSVYYYYIVDGVCTCT